MAILKNKSFWLAVVALLQTLLLNYFHIPQDIWLAIDGIIAVLIAAFTVEEAATKVVAGLREFTQAYLSSRKEDKK